MRLSTKAQYAVRAMVSLTLHGGDTPVSMKSLAQWEDISLTYLEQLFVKLRRGQIVRSVRGPGGGYVLARPAGEIRIDQIIDTVEEALSPLSCMDDAGSCQCKTRCITHDIWQGLGEQIRTFLASKTLEDLAREGRKKMCL
ncbi:MAG: Rrf2 family transcriptional regulator [Deltaproteobacteria bacterium]|nr:Rrf2 family transcriptional regulator [Deltaproteobacteria bacterium]NCP02953.1 Rrf2 family transcriptional regulator [Deltaproteobacteria bacterium]NCP78585.1 Rrf2 family transcriptional regulator [Desulfuromonadales bacterium]